MIGGVTAVIVTRGNVDLGPILETMIWDNVMIWNNTDGYDAGSYGRWIAAMNADTPLVYTQDDDCIVTEEAQVALLHEWSQLDGEGPRMVSNMDPLHNEGRMPYLALPGWGSLITPEAVRSAVARWRERYPEDREEDWRRVGSDIVVPVLTPSVMVDLGHTNLPYAEDASRTYRQPGYHAKKNDYYRRAAALREEKKT